MSRKVGLHIQAISSPAHADWIIACRPPAIKILVPNRPFIQRYKDEVGGLVTARIHSSVDNFDPNEGDFSNPRAKGELWANKIDAYFQHCHDLIDCVYLWNEVGQSGDDVSRNADATVRAVEILHRRGWRVAVGAFSTGNPAGNSAEIKAILSRFQQALEVADAVSLHQYWAPRLDSVNDGVEVREWHALRHRKLLGFLDELGIPRKPILIGETGVDHGIQSHQKQIGWRGGQKNGGPNPPVEPVAIQDYVNDLVGFDAEISQDPDVLAAFLFNTVDDAGYGWQTFEVAYEPAIQSFIRQGALPIKWPSGLTPPAPVPPPGGAMIIGEGLRKAEKIVGPYLESEIYHWPGTDNEVSLAIGEKGYATWSRRTNETIAYTYSGEVYRDYGNRRFGKLVGVSSP